jgi:hypothetical protein
MAKVKDRQRGRLSRRELLQSFASSAAALALPAFLPQIASALEERSLPASRPAAFELVPASRSGITWAHVAGLSKEMYLPETVGPGCAFLDYDNDGWMDIYLVNSGACDFFQPTARLRNALYRNNRDGTFTDVTAKAGVPGDAYGMGVAVGDYDGDGFPDLYVTQYPHNILYRNNGDGTFTDVTAKAGVAAPGWGTSAVWFDYDNDGRLDLFVCNFAEFRQSANVACGGPADRSYCKPNIYKPLPSRLFHNNGDGTFTDVSQSSGIAKSLGKAWGVVAADVNNDGFMDLFVANDTTPNSLFMNRGNGGFEDVGVLSGVAYSQFGIARSGMGVDAADVEQNGWMDLFVANVDHEGYALYHNNKDESFDDIAQPSGMAVTSMMSGWGLKFFDYNNDGNLDLLIANGHPDTTIERHMEGVQYTEPLLLFENSGKAWKNVSAQSGEVFSRRFAGRGLALGDFDNDGSVDVLIGINDGPPVLLRNRAGGQNHWVGIRLIGRKANRDAIGARVVYRAGKLQRQVTKVGGGSYLSSHDPRLVLGLGQETQLDWLEVHWPKPSTVVDRFTDLKIDCYTTLIEGQSSSKKPDPSKSGQSG